MKIAIIGTRGIPNNYGGFEQLAEHLSVGLKGKGHDVYVYSSDKHQYKKETWMGIHLIHKYDPEKQIGTIGQFVYDFNCIIDSRRRNFNVIINLGYTSSSIWMRFFSRSSKVITNMDGLEWKRTKYSRLVQKFLMYAEKLAVKHSNILVADSLGIKSYLQKKYNQPSVFIAYGALLFNSPNDFFLNRFNVAPFSYNMLIARMEPENNIEMILDGIHESQSQCPFLVVGNTKNKFGMHLTNKYKDDSRIIFTGSIYEAEVINNLRYYSKIYFHGHSVGGTNPSLLEAMACKCLIAAHDNEFNKSVLGNNGFYFSEKSNIAALVDTCDRNSENNKRITDDNYKRVASDYSWNKIVSQYEEIILNA